MADALTTELPRSKALALRYGGITLARHGEPHIERKVWLDAEGYRRFWASYEVLGILPGQMPPKELAEFVAKAGAIIASTRQRSIESMTHVAAGREFARDPLFVEAPLPPPAWPSWIRLTPAAWGFVARLWWWFFDHHEGQETRAEAERRSDDAADMLIELASGGEDVVVLAHGFFNFMIGRSLQRRGWRLAYSGGYKYWSMRRFERM